MSLLNKGKNQNSTVSKQVKASTAYTICSVIQRCMSFITLPIFSRILSTDEYGLSTIYSSTMAILIIFTSLQLPYGTLTTAMVKFENDRFGYISAANGLCTFLTFAYFAVYIPFHIYWNKILDLPTILMIIMGVEMLMTTSINLWMGRERYVFEYKKVVALTLFQSIAGTAISVICVLLSDSNKGIIRIVSGSLTTIAIGFFVYIYSIGKGKKFYDKEYWHYALSFNIPLIPYYVSQMIFNQSDRLMINSICGRSDAAKYGVAYNLALVLNFVLNSINSAYTPWLYRKIKDRDFETNKKVSFAIAILMSVLLLGVIALAPEIIFVMAGSKYADAVWVVPPVAMSLIFLFYTQLFANLEFYFEEKYYLVGGSILSAVINIVLNAWFIPIFGFVAAAYTTLFSFIIFAACNYWCMVRVCKKHEIDYHIYDLKKLIGLSLIFMVAGFVLMAFYKVSIVRYCMIAVVLVGCFIKRKRLISSVRYYLNLFR